MKNKYFFITLFAFLLLPFISVTDLIAHEKPNVGTGLEVITDTHPFRPPLPPNHPKIRVKVKSDIKIGDILSEYEGNEMLIHSGGENGPRIDIYNLNISDEPIKTLVIPNEIVSKNTEDGNQIMRLIEIVVETVIGDVLSEYEGNEVILRRETN